MKMVTRLTSDLVLQIWDTAGQERFRSITQSYYRSANALLLVYDISCQSSFDCLPDWLREIEMYASTNVLTYLVGKKMSVMAISNTDLLSYNLSTDRMKIKTRIDGTPLTAQTTCPIWSYEV